MMTQSEHGSDDLVGVAPARRAPRRALRSRVSSGHVVMVVAGLLGLLLSLSVLRKADTTVAVVVVARDLAPGTRLLPDMVRTTRIHADDRLLTNLVMTDGFDAVRGSVVLATLRDGDLLARSNLGPASTQRAARAVSFPVDAALAVGGQLSAGDDVDVLASANDGSGSGYVLAGVDVVAVHSSGAGPLRGSDGKLSLTVAVDSAGAQRLAAALHVADLLVVRSTGASPVAPVPWFVPGGRDG
jgi:Flp pilus assembly protein CpaB